MDKKQNYYSRQGSNKALVSEPRKSSDFSKTLPRNGKRRENPNSNYKNDYNQRNYNVLPKLRTNVDKRPKPRNYTGAYTTSALPINVSTASSGLALEHSAINDGDNNDFDVELNSIYSQGSKKQNLNHLLNFHYNTWENDRGGLNVFGRNGNRNYAKKHKYNKEQFLQANFQFVIKSSAEPRIDASCPDTLVEWSLIEQINIQTTEEPQCPICLYPPISAKLTRCGHVYCWPCILHYLALSDKTWRKCPICYEAIHLADLKSTSIVQQNNFKVGDFVTLQLMRRKKGSMFIEKVSTNNENCMARREHIPHLTDSEELTRFSKFLLANPDEIATILEKEHKELIFGEDLNCPESVFIQQALDLLQERKNLNAQEVVVKVEETHIKINNTENPLLEITIAQENINENSKLTGNNEQNIEDNQSTKNEALLENSVTNGAVRKDKYYYFYQNVDGQNIYLHPINVKMLQAMYGSLDRGPVTITSKILQKESQSMDEDLRKKFTCLGHLPLTCQFEIVEVQFQPPMISDEILKMFKDDIIMRQKIRQRRAREEKKREREIDEINERQMGKLIARSANIDIQSSQQFPTCGFEESLSGNSFDQSAASLAYASELADSPPITYRNGFASFANILSSPKKELWPTLENTDSGNNSITTTDLTWAKAMSSTTLVSKPILSSGRENRISETESNNDLREDTIHITRNNLSDVLAEAFEKKKKSGSQTDIPIGNNKKNKKNKKTLLFSTGMSFGAK